MDEVDLHVLEDSIAGSGDLEDGVLAAEWASTPRAREEKSMFKAVPSPYLVPFDGSFRHR
jgi:hypothetical protein